MSHWQKIREEASRLRQEVYTSFDLNSGILTNPENLIDSALEYLELEFSPEHPDSANLYKSLAVLEDDVIYFNNHLPRWFKNYCIAHEIGHFVLHNISTHCAADDLEDFSSDDETPSAAKQVKGYGARERREREANLFALEFLLPCDVLRQSFLTENLNAEAISKIVGLPSDMVAGQLARALLTPLQPPKEEREVRDFDLDDSQRAAAETDRCPVLIAAGPGTGKTQTLIKRILFLLEKGTSPHKILALTFSNRATEEMRERIAAVRPNEAKQMKIMTFHSFGLDILRRFYEEASLDNDSELLDKIDALLFLEKNLVSINLEHYQSLHEPTQNLPAILAAISRAKDELVTPAQYLALAEKMAADAENDEDSEKAAKAIETALVYEFYQNHLTRHKLLDFGDLIFRAVKLLQQNESIRQSLQNEFDAVLVDEFQDVNRACGVLLKEVVGDGTGLWAVGDLRQSIYRWRGASPANIRLFAQDFPNAETLSLENNYRSKSAIINTFSVFAGQMKAASEDVFCNWRASREEGAEEHFPVSVDLSDSLATEAETLANNILSYRENGIAYKEQAVICRTHNQLNSFAETLSRRGIPIFYLGELFEREEIRDLLALLDLRHSKHGHALVRIGHFPEYNLPLEDIQLILGFIREQEISFLEILENSEIAVKLSSDGQIAWEKIKNHLLKLKDDFSAWKFLSEYLFNQSQYLRFLISDEDIQSEQKLLAIYQFLNFTGNLEKRFASFGSEQIPEFLRYVKKLAWFGEDKNFSQIPSVAENLDAVRLLTVHSAKGLEFRAVYLPYLGAGKIPSNRKGQICPAPQGMLASSEDFHDEEEECLFFVAMSRARDHLHLSRSLVYGSGNSKESKFLTVLAEHLPVARSFASTDDSQIKQIENLVESYANQIYYSADLDRYLRCPRDYYYTNLLGLKGKGDVSVYLKFHSCVYDTIYSLQTIRKLENIEVTEQTALSRLQEFWQAANLDDHAYSPIYKKKAEEIVRVMCDKITQSTNEILRKSYEIQLENGTIRVRPDAVEIFEEGGEKRVVVRRYRTGKSPKEAKIDNVDALMLEAVQQKYPEAKSTVQKIFLTDNISQDVPVSKKVLGNRLKKYQNAINGIGSNQFPADPSEDNCPHCSHFFVCPSGEHKI
jgi:superfamily I DNA/RNA helicase